MTLDEDEVEKLKARLQSVCNQLQELGASAVVVAATFETIKNGVVGHNRAWRREGNFFETYGLVEAIRLNFIEDAKPEV